MAKTSYADVHLDVDPGTPQTERIRGQQRPDRDTPFRILVLGDFSGRGSRGILTKGPRKPIAVDRDNFEDLLKSLNVQLRLPLEGGTSLDLEFRELDDFHPDRLFESHSMFRKLRQLREDLEDPATFLSAARQLGVEAGGAKQQPASPPPPATESLLSGSLLDQALEATESRGSSSRPSDPMAQFLQSVVAPHLVPKADPKKKELIQMADAAIGGSMRAVLHHPAFQELEANWRSLYLLVREVETSPKLKIYLIDISAQEIDADIASADDMRTTALYRVIVEQTVGTPGADPWAVIVGAYSFGPSMEDLNRLARLGLLARKSGAPLLASAMDQLLGCQSIAASPYPEDWTPGPEQEGWNLIRSLPEARYIGLTIPRFLARMPYGQSGERTERFDFEEMPGAPIHRHYLWGNAAFLAACLLGQNFSEFGWTMDGTEILTVNRLPLHMYKDGGESKITPCMETCLSMTSIEAIGNHGLMVFIAYAGRDEARLAGFRSIASGGEAIAGRWG
ncbi:MAG: type VI secretion system contractile sheath large subunit [Bryobacterales bacterium]|nr:type VI secretion system contractile sheath large subunit [Bryobacterales bacterium]